MIDYRFTGRLVYLSGGPLSVQMNAWPSAESNWWEPTTGSATCVGAYQAKGAASLAASYVNLANPGTHDLTAGNAPTFDTSTGWTFNGTDDYLITDITPDGDRTSTAIVRFSDHGGTDYQLLFGQWTGSGSGGRYGISPKWGGSGIYFDNLGYSFTSPAVTNGVLGFNNSKAYLNGSELLSPLTSEGGSISYPIYVGCWNNNGTAGNHIAAKIQAFVIYSSVLDSTQVAEISTNMAAL